MEDSKKGNIFVQNINKPFLGRLNVIFLSFADDVSHKNEETPDEDFRVARNNIIDTPRLCGRWLLRIPSAVRGFSWFRVFGNTEGIGPRDAVRKEQGEREARGRFAQHRITERHVIGRRPSRLVGTDELLREKEPRGGVRGAGQEAWIAGRRGEGKEGGCGERVDARERFGNAGRVRELRRQRRRERRGWARAKGSEILTLGQAAPRGPE